MLENFFLISIISTLLIFVNWTITYEVLGKVWNLLPHLHFAPRLRVLMLGAPIFLAHITGIWLFAAAYFIIENYTSLGSIIGHERSMGLTLESFFDCLYFSAASYTSLGLGDLIPTRHLRMLVAAEVLNGLVMIGWTVSFTYLAMERFWSQPAHKRK